MSIDFELDIKYKYVSGSIDLAEVMVQFRAAVKVAMIYRDPQKGHENYYLS